MTQPTEDQDTKEELTESIFEINYLKELGLFEMAWSQCARGSEERMKFFSVRLVPENFQKMSYDMLRMVKEFNLMQAQQYEQNQKETENQKAIEDLQQQKPVEGTCEN